MGDFDDLGAIPTSSGASSPPQGVNDFADLGATPSDTPPQPNMSPTSKIMNGSVAAQRKDLTPDQHEARTFLDDWMSGWQTSTTALGLTRQKLPDTVLPEHADRLARILSMAGTFAGDVPAMAAGMIGGGAAGAAVSAGIGAPVGAMAGAFALPAAIRQTLMDHYKKGDIQNFSDFYDRASATLLAGLKSGTLGAAAGAAGLATGGLLPAAMSPLLKLGATTASEAAVMTGVGAAMDGKMPSSQDFIDNAAFMTLMHGVSKGVGVSYEPVKNKLMDVFAKTGLQPHEVSTLAAKDPVLHQQLLSSDDTVPQALKDAADPHAPKDTHVEINPNPELTKKVDGLSSATNDEEAGKLMVKPLDDKDNPSIPDEPGEEKKRSVAVNTVLSRIGEQEDAPKEKTNFDKLYYNLLDQYDPLKNMTKALLGEEALGTKEDPNGLARSLGNVSRKADEIIENGPRDFDSLKKTGTSGLRDIWAKADDLKELRAYQISKHVIDLESSGIETGVDVSAAKKVVKELGPKYKDIAKENVKFNNDNIDYLADSGVLSKEKAEIMKDKWQNYSAMNRVMGTDEQVNSSGGGKGITPFNPIKAIKGSERAIIDPLASNIINTHKIITMAERNRAAKALTDLIDLANSKGDTSWGKKAKTPMSATDLTPEETAKILEKQGFDPKEAQNLNDVSTIFRAEKVPLADDQIASYTDGKRNVYEGVPKDIVDAVRGMDSKTVGAFVKMLSGPSKLLRTGMLNSPAFAVRHFFRQEVLAASLSKDLHLPVIETVKGMAGMMGDDFGDWIMHGGGGDSIGGIDNDYIKSKIFDLNEKTGQLDKSWNKVTNGLQVFKHAIELTDEARTFQKYRNRVSSGETKDNFQAQYDARDTGIDVHRTGASMTAYAALDPFQNIKIQGLDLISRRIKDDPMSVVPKLLATITLPSLVLWSQNHDKDWYKNLTPQDRDMNWHFAVGDPDNGGHVIRMPKPFEPGIVFGSLVERLCDKFFSDNPHSLKGFMKTVTDAVAPGYVPTFLQPVVEAYANKSFLTDSPLISKHMEGILPEYQSNPYTSSVAKVVASGLRQIPIPLTQKPGALGSPIIVDNFIKEWTGGVGQLVIAGVDKALQKSGLADKMGIDYNHAPPESVWSDNPFLKSFVLRYPSVNTKSVGDFFDRFSEAQVRLDTIKNRMQMGDTANAQKEMLSAQEANEMFKLDGFKKTISEQMGLIQKITIMPGMSPHEKRQQIDVLSTTVTKAAALANQMLDSMDAQNKQNKKAVGQ